MVSVSRNEWGIKLSVKSFFGQHPMNQIFTYSLFILGCLFSLRFLEEQQRNDFYKGGPKAPMNQMFFQILFLFWGVYFSLRFFGEQERKDFYKGGPSAQ